ncbi:MAG: hypothetical protein ACFB03_11110 [Paracoccaceae bacterium]
MKVIAAAEAGNFEKENPMDAVLAKINTFRLKQGKYCSRLFYYCADNWVPQEAIFYLAATNYIFNRDALMVRVFTDVLWTKGNELSLNLRFNNLNALRRIISAPEVTVNQGTAKHTNLINQGGLRFGSAGDYNVMTRAIEHCTDRVSQTTIMQGERLLKEGKDLVGERNEDARRQAKRQVNDLLGPLIGSDPLKKLGVFH